MVDHDPAQDELASQLHDGLVMNIPTVINPKPGLFAATQPVIATIPAEMVLGYGIGSTVLWTAKPSDTAAEPRGCPDRRPG